MRHIVALSLVALWAVVGCGAGHISGADDDAAIQHEPEWSACVSKGEFETCAEVCAAQGKDCVAAGCVANPMSCKPDACDRATSVLSLGPGICEDPSGGGYIAGACEDPIEFIFNDTARCCCEG